MTATIRRSLFLCLGLLVGGVSSRAAQAESLLVEAESFEEHGGWGLDTQFIEIMGSPYLLAHGMGTPVKDAQTTVTFPATGTYRVFVRTKDWVARWQAPGQPGRFQVLINGQPLKTTFGTQGADWFWQSGGSIEITQPETKIALRDLTGFNGRCDALWFTTDTIIALAIISPLIFRYARVIWMHVDELMDPRKE